MKQILIIEDDPRIAGLERDYLEARAQRKARDGDRAGCGL